MLGEHLQGPPTGNGPAQWSPCIHCCPPQSAVRGGALIRMDFWSDTVWLLLCSNVNKPTNEQ